MKAACATMSRLGGTGSRAKRRGSPLRRGRTRLSTPRVLGPTLGPDRPVLVADRPDFPENSTRHCSWLCSVRRRAGDRVLGCQEQTRDAQGDIPQKERQSDVRQHRCVEGQWLLQPCYCPVHHRAPPLDPRTANSALDVQQQRSCHTVNRLKPLCCVSRLRQVVKFSDVKGTRGRRPDRSPWFSMSTNLQSKSDKSAPYSRYAPYRPGLLTVEKPI